MNKLNNQAVFPIMTENEYRLPVCMHGVGYSKHQYPISRPEGFPYFQWIQCVSGEGRLITEGQTQTVRKNQVMFLFPNSPHEYYPVREPWEVYWLIFGGHGIRNLASLARIIRSGVYTLTHSEIFLTHMKNACSIAQSKRGLAGLECAKLSYMMLMDMIRYITFNDASMEQDYVRLQPVFEYIEKNYAGLITLDDLSQIMGITSQHFCLLFRNLAAMRPMEYVNWVRISKSKDILCRQRDKKIYEVSKLVGVQDPRYFSKIFKKIEGMTPEAFKKMNGLAYSSHD